ncbi:MAG TPA: tRNA (N(6)-L-threonylcarbamoyladenosine(37)-C(2))-methylthiotransferase MtaB [Syntrophaceae bacterium]|nr:tRNA (N(6)-L-threonylcarbamoyladenosine(37)-C(2))-methylthiotransferase MtaB [Syntrophaceae bacterium]
MDRIGIGKLKTVLIHTLGCKVNQCESAYMGEVLSRYGFSPALEGKADICIVNTCTVTQRADYQSRQLIRRVIKENPEASIIVTGCCAQIAAGEIASIPGVDYIIGNKEKAGILHIIKNASKQISPKIYVSPFTVHDKIQDMCVEGFMDKTRAFLKIQDGCDAYCTYCIVPYARGRSRSLLPHRVFKHIKLLTQNGYKEIVLTGIHLGHYGLDLSPQTNILDLLRTLEEITHCRIRLSSLEPTELSLSFIRHMAASKIMCPHLHIPLQSGDDNILKRMNRTYSISYFKDLIHEIIENIPDICIGVDVMAGFPGEEEREFINTYTLIESLPIGYLHVFPYSRRKGTQAFRFPHHVASATVTARAKKLRELGNRKRRAFYQKNLRKMAQVLVECKRDTHTGLLKGFTKNYIPVLIEGDDDLKNQIVEVELKDIIEDSTYNMKVRGIRTSA